MNIEIRNVSCGYKQGMYILKNCSFSISSGEICCILGPNGVGKTTLFQTILQLIKPLDGSICIDGQDCRGWSAGKLSGAMAYVAQNHIPMFAYKVKDVIMMGRFGRLGCFSNPTENDIRIVSGIAEEMGLSEMMEKPYTSLSGGQRQLVMIARAVAQQPAFLILDEPTSGLDYSNSVKVLKMLRSLAGRGLGIIMTTHDPGHAFLCDSKAVILASGGVIASGKAVDVVTEDNLQKAYGISIRVAEFLDENHQPVHVCSPRM